MHSRMHIHGKRAPTHPHQHGGSIHPPSHSLTHSLSDTHSLYLPLFNWVCNVKRRQFSSGYCLSATSFSTTIQTLTCDQNRRQTWTCLHRATFSCHQKSKHRYRKFSSSSTRTEATPLTLTSWTQPCSPWVSSRKASPASAAKVKAWNAASQSNARMVKMIWCRWTRLMLMVPKASQSMSLQRWWRANSRATAHWRRSGLPLQCSARGTPALLLVGQHQVRQQAAKKSGVVWTWMGFAEHAGSSISRLVRKSWGKWWAKLIGTGTGLLTRRSSCTLWTKLCGSDPSMLHSPVATFHAYLWPIIGN